jgi:hypothetical protein
VGNGSYSLKRHPFPQVTAVDSTFYTELSRF